MDVGAVDTQVFAIIGDNSDATALPISDDPLLQSGAASAPTPHHDEQVDGLPDDPFGGADSTLGVLAAASVYGGGGGGGDGSGAPSVVVPAQQQRSGPHGGRQQAGRRARGQWQRDTHRARATLAALAAANFSRITTRRPIITRRPPTTSRRTSSTTTTTRRPRSSTMRPTTTTTRRHRSTRRPGRCRPMGWRARLVAPACPPATAWPGQAR